MNPPIAVAHVLGALDFGGVETDALLLLRHLPPARLRSSVVYVGEVAVSSQIRRELVEGLGLPARRVRTVFNSCEVDAVAVRAAASRAARPPDPAPVVLMVARMDDAKDHTTLMEAVSLLLNAGV